MDTWSRRLAPVASRRWLRIGAGLVLPLVALGLQLLAWDYIRPSLWLFFYPAVFLSGWVGGRTAGILATLLSIGCVDWFFMDPIHELGPPRDAAQAFKLGLFGVMGLLFAQAHEIRHRSLLRLTRSEAELRALFETAPLGIAVIDSHNARILAANPRYAAIMGRAPEALATLDWTQITHPEDIQAHLDNMARLNPGARPAGAAGARPRHLCMVEDITARRQAEAARQASEAKFAAAFQNSPMGILITRLDDGQIIEINPALEAMVGYTREEAIGRTTPELLVWEDVEDRQRLQMEIRTQGSLNDREQRFRRRNGEIMICRLSLTALKVNSEVLVLCTVIDITRRKAAEEQLAAAHRNMRLAAQAAHVGFWSLDVRTYAIEWDDEILRIFGITRERFDQNPTQTLWLDMLHPDDRAQADTETFLKAEHEDEVSWEFRIVRPDGEIRHLMTRFAVLRDAEGAPARMVGLNYDLTDLRRREAALRETNAYLDNLLNYANAPIIVWDPQYRITRFNHAFEQLTGYRESEVIGEALTRLFPPEQAEVSMALIRDTTTGERWESVEIAIQRCDGALRTVLWNSATVFAEDGRTPQATIAQGQDITERKQAEASLAAAKAAAEAANRAKSQFLAHMSHEIRTPMNGVLGLAQLLEQEPLAHEQREMVRQIREAGRLLLGIINDILDLSKIEAGQLRLERRPFDLERSLANVLHVMAAPAEAKGLGLRLEAATGLAVPWLGDALRLEQILFNLTGNAIKFTAAGEVVIQVRSLETSTPDPARFRFEVRDTGIGLSPEDLERLFTPFVQADGSITRRFGGTGLGLSICKRLVELMGGAIGVSSVLDQSSVFWFELPLERAAASAEAVVTPAEPETDAAPRLDGLRVLVVDDNQINRHIIERALRRENVVVTLAVDGQQALDCLRARAGAFDAVLMDIQMPVLDGLAATRAIRADPGLAALPVIALTAGVTTEEREAALAAGMDDFLAKPVELEQMRALLARYVRRD